MACFIFDSNQSSVLISPNLPVVRKDKLKNLGLKPSIQINWMVDPVAGVIRFFQENKEVEVPLYKLMY